MTNQALHNELQLIKKVNEFAKLHYTYLIALLHKTHNKY